MTVVERVSPVREKIKGATPPHRNVGKLVFTDESERGHNLLADFVESVWMQAGSEDYAVSFAPSTTEATLWVSGRSQEVVDGVLDETIDRLKGGFERSGEVLEVRQAEPPTGGLRHRIGRAFRLG